MFIEDSELKPSKFMMSLYNTFCECGGLNVILKLITY
jgi:hypothetical protein